MSNVCRIGIKYMAEKMDEQQQQLDHALVMSIQADHKAGMQGQPLPYQLRSDAVVTSIVLVCFIFVLVCAEARQEVCGATDQVALPV